MIQAPLALQNLHDCKQRRSGCIDKVFENLVILLMLISEHKQNLIDILKMSISNCKSELKNFKNVIKISARYLTACIPILEHSISWDQKVHLIGKKVLISLLKSKIDILPLYFQDHFEAFYTFIFNQNSFEGILWHVEFIFDISFEFQPSAYAH